MKKHAILSIIYLCILIGCKVRMGLSILDWINVTFLLGIIALVFTVTINIWKTGFFSLFVVGFRVIGNAVIPRTRSAERADRLIKNDYSLNQWKNKMATWTSYLFTNLAVISLMMSLISLIGYYQ